MLSSDLAREMGITALDLHHYLIDVGFLYRERNTYELKLCKRYAGLGYAKTRSHFRYNSKGDLVETRFPMWTEDFGAVGTFHTKVHRQEDGSGEGDECRYLQADGWY